MIRRAPRRRRIMRIAQTREARSGMAISGQRTLQATAARENIARDNTVLPTTCWDQSNNRRAAYGATQIAVAAACNGRGRRRACPTAVRRGVSCSGSSRSVGMGPRRLRSSSANAVCGMSDCATARGWALCTWAGGVRGLEMDYEQEGLRRGVGTWATADCDEETCISQYQ